MPVRTRRIEHNQLDFSTRLSGPETGEDRNPAVRRHGDIPGSDLLQDTRRCDVTSDLDAGADVDDGYGEWRVWHGRQ
jgi:hypothetical protein